MKRRQLLAATVAAVVGSLVLASTLADAHAGHANVVINISGNQYSQTFSSIYEQDLVVWQWTGPDTDHSVTADPGQAEQFDSDPGRTPKLTDHAVGDSFSYFFRVPGRYTFYCKTHPEMRGTIEVKKIDTVAPQVSSMAVRPPRLVCKSRRKRCTQPLLEMDLSEDADVSGYLERLVRRRWRPVRPIGPLFFPRGLRRKPILIGRLAPGRYRLLLSARDGTNNSSPPRAAPFVVAAAKRPHRRTRRRAHRRRRSASPR